MVERGIFEGYLECSEEAFERFFSVHPRGLKNVEISNSVPGVPIRLSCVPPA
jgi:hypothetical protein